MKPRHQPIKGRSHSRMIARDESGAADLAIETEPHKEKISRVTQLKNVELQRTPHGQFLVFKSRDGATFSMNLDVQEEFGFEAKTTLQEWADEQG